MSNNKKRILYIVSRENVLQPGVLKSQVLEMASQIKKEGEGTDVSVLNQD